MKPTPRLFAGIALAFVMLVTCGTAFGKHHAAVYKVLPNGTDDTASLQAAFDAAVQAGPGSTVQLVKGTYHTGQIVVNGFQGRFLGAGAGQTVLTNLPNLYVTLDGFRHPPSADNPWPALFAFVGGDIQVSDLGIRITGSTPTTGWSNFGMFDPPVRAMCIAFAVCGPPRTNATFSRVCIEGEPDPAEPVFGYNLWNGIYFEGFIGEMPFPPISGSIVVRDSEFRHMVSGTPISNLSDASVLITRNRFEDVLFGMDGGGLLNSSFEFSFNRVDGAFGINLYDVGYFAEADSSQVTSSKLLIRNNVFKGQYGVYLDTTFVGENECRVVANDFRDVTEAGVYLGSGTSDCLVKHNTPTSIVDLGTDNVIENGGHPAGCMPGPVRTVLQVDGWFEGIATAPNGDVFTSDQETFNVYRITPEGEVTLFAHLFDQDNPDAAYAGALGLTFGPDGALWLNMTDWTETSRHGVYRVAMDGSFELAVPLDVNQTPAPNGLVFDDRGNLFITDCFMGSIWKVARGERVATLWLQHELLQPLTAFGANGIAYKQGALYVANSDQGTVLRIPIDRHGAPGEPVVFASGMVDPDGNTLAPDGITLGPGNDLYLTLAYAGQLVRLAEDGTWRVVADLGISLAASPTFGKGKDRFTAYVTNFGTDGTTPTVVKVNLCEKNCRQERHRP